MFFVVLPVYAPDAVEKWRERPDLCAATLAVHLIRGKAFPALPDEVAGKTLFNA